MTISADEKPFLAAICADPADDTPRLVFADWLQENGKPEQAEFIRIQCELARGHVEPIRRIQLEHREAALAKAHGKFWVKEFGELTGLQYAHGHKQEEKPGFFCRGFVRKASSSRNYTALNLAERQIAYPVECLQLELFVGEVKATREPRTDLERMLLAALSKSREKK